MWTPLDSTWNLWGRVKSSLALIMEDRKVRRAKNERRLQEQCKGGRMI
jgi:hypothetical protein